MRCCLHSLHRMLVCHTRLGCAVGWVSLAPRAMLYYMLMLLLSAESGQHGTQTPCSVLRCVDITCGDIVVEEMLATLHMHGMKSGLGRMNTILWMSEAVWMRPSGVGRVSSGGPFPGLHCIQYFTSCMYQSMRQCVVDVTH